MAAVVAWRCALSVLLAYAMARRGHARGALSTSGACAALGVGILHLSCGVSYGAVLIAFYLSSSRLTRLRQATKARYVPTKHNGQRNATQAGGCSTAPTACLSVHNACMHCARQRDACMACAAHAAAHARSAGVVQQRGWRAGSAACGCRARAVIRAGDGAGAASGRVVRVPGELAAAGRWQRACAHLPCWIWEAVSCTSDVAGCLLGCLQASYACCCGDTYASELGMLSAAPPRLITSWQRVPRGVNGAVSALGLAASAAGGVCMAAVMAAAGRLSGESAALVPLMARLLRRGAGVQQLASSVAGQQQAAAAFMLLLGMLAGVAGSLLDSLLGARWQFSGYCEATQRVVGRPGPRVRHISGCPCLSNEAVNALAAALSSITVGVGCYWSAAV